MFQALMPFLLIFDLSRLDQPWYLAIELLCILMAKGVDHEPADLDLFGDNRHEILS